MANSKTVEDILANGENTGVFRYIASKEKGKVSLDERFNPPVDFDSMRHHGMFDVGNSKYGVPFVFATEKGINIMIENGKMTEDELPRESKNNYRKWLSNKEEIK